MADKFEFTVQAHSFDEALAWAQKHECVKGPYYDENHREVEFVTVRLTKSGREWVFRAEPWEAEHGKP